MNRVKKVAITVGLSTTIIFSTFVSTSFANSFIYEKDNQETISSGVTHRSLLKFGQKGWLNVNAIYIDLKNPTIELDLLTSANGLSTKDTISNMAKQRNDIVSAINGDFFYMLNPDSPLGAMVKDGKMISSPVTAHNYATFSVTNDYLAFADYWQHEILATTESGKQIPISSINKYTDKYQYIMLIDRNWGAKTPGYSSNLQEMVEVLVIDDVVTEIRHNQPSIEIPENGYVILASKAGSQWAQADTLLNNLQVGDRLTIHTNIQPNIENIKLAMGGGTLLVKNGQVANFTQSISGAHPRTALGITADRSQVIFVTVDGRHSSFTGVDGKELANLMIELGGYEAIVLDGGGSTTMVTRELGDASLKRVTTPSDGYERKVINGIAVVTKAPVDSLKGIKAAIDDPRSFVGVPREITIKAFDKNYNPLNVDPSQIRYSLKSGNGYFEGNQFIPSQPGKAVIEVNYLGSTAEVTVEVLQELANLVIIPEKDHLELGKTTNVKVMGSDTNGYRASINVNAVNWKDRQGLGKMNNGVYTAGGTAGITTLEASYNGIQGEVQIIIGSSTQSSDSSETLNAQLGNTSNQLMKDRLNKPYEKEGIKVFAYSGVQFNQYTLLDRIVGNKISNLVNENHQVSLFTGAIDGRISGNISKPIVEAKGGYSAVEQGDSLILQLDNRSNGLRATDFNQWPWLKDTLQSTEKKNIFITMPKPILGKDGFSDKLEAELFMEILSEAASKGKSVFVVHGGTTTSVDVIDGVRYISMAPYQEGSTNSNTQQAFKYVEFNITENETTYQIKPLFE